MTKSVISLTLALACTAAAARAQDSTALEWSRVRRLEPGRTLTVTSVGSAPAERYFVAADDSRLMLLNLTDASLSASAARLLRDIASLHPEYIEGAAKGRTFLLERVVLSSGGVYVANRKVADLQEVIETAPRGDVAEITIRQKGRGFWGHLGPLGGYVVGAFAGGFGAGLVCRAAAGDDRCDNGAFLLGMTIGGLAGGTYGWHAARRETEDSVYSRHP